MQQQNKRRWPEHSSNWSAKRVFAPRHCEDVSNSVHSHSSTSTSTHLDIFNQQPIKLVVRVKVPVDQHPQLGQNSVHTDTNSKPFKSFSLIKYEPCYTGGQGAIIAWTLFMESMNPLLIENEALKHSGFF